LCARARTTLAYATDAKKLHRSLGISATPKDKNKTYAMNVAGPSAKNWKNVLEHDRF